LTNVRPTKAHSATVSNKINQSECCQAFSPIVSAELAAQGNVSANNESSNAKPQDELKRCNIELEFITLSSTLLGFVLGAGLGISLAVGIVYVETLDKSLMPWIITSQTIPILALAPMVIVVFGAMGISGLLPKALISMYLCFFPVAVGMVKGLRSPQPMLVDLLNTYSASKWQVFWRLRLPSAVPFLFASLKVAIALSLVGAIVAELPTGGQAGLGARLLSGSYYGQTNLIWASLIVAAVMSASLVSILGIIERKVCYRLAGGQEGSNEL